MNKHSKLTVHNSTGLILHFRPSTSHSGSSSRYGRSASQALQATQPQASQAGTSRPQAGTKWRIRRLQDRDSSLAGYAGASAMCLLAHLGRDGTSAAGLLRCSGFLASRVEHWKPPAGVVHWLSGCCRGPGAVSHA